MVSRSAVPPPRAVSISSLRSSACSIRFSVSCSSFFPLYDSLGCATESANEFAGDPDFRDGVWDVVFREAEAAA